MSMPSVRSALPEERQAVLQTLMLAFAADPLVRWLTPKSEVFLGMMVPFFDAFGGAAFDHGTAFVAEEGKAAALWLPPGIEPDVETMGAMMQERGDPALQTDAFAVLEHMGRYHPDAPCWYLPIIGADPAHQGQGLGAALMKHALERCDQEGQVAYLESSNERNVSLYQRHGFEIMGRIQHGSSPVVTPMIRVPR
jgi:ribosomal protein S18 acetylase RimI-like enzyme